MFGLGAAKPWRAGLSSAAASALALAAALLGTSLGAPAQTVSLVTTGSTWKYFKGRSEASTPDPTAWRLPAFDDSAWASGPATFYYGESFSGTLLGDMQNSYTTLYLRQPFVVKNLASLATLILSVINDDGFIAWINGRQVASTNAPTGAVAFNSVASAGAVEPVAYEDYLLGEAAGLLTEGTNMLAVLVFNVGLTSSDLVFDAELRATLKETVPPVITAVAPPPGVVTSLTQITVTFSEPVQGVDAGDLFLNSANPASVTGGPVVWTFNFAQPPFGTVAVSWSLNSGITDQAVPPNAFNPRGPGASWLYELVDPTLPSIALLHPPSGRTVRNLTQVEVTFDRAVTGVEAFDLLVNSAPAQQVTGLGAGPYVFEFAAVPAGAARFTWRADHGIVEDSPAAKPFTGQPFEYTVDPLAPVGDVVINEFMAENVSGLRDEESDQEDWIELFNRGNTDVNLAGWALTDDATEPGKWVFPAITLRARQYLVVFASAKDRRPTAPGGRLHTNFKLGVNGEYLGLFNAESPRQAVDELSPEFPEQRNDFSFGRDAAGRWRYFNPATPGLPNGASTITGVVSPVHFSVRRGFFNSPFNLSLATETPGAQIRYTFDGSPPTESNGLVYTGPVPIHLTRIVRAAAFKPNHLPSRVETHTYLFNLPLSRRHLPALSLVTATNHLYGATGIMEVSPRNTTKHGMAWERPVSAELIRPEDNAGFQIDCGIRIQGGGYIRERYNYRSTTLPESKYSFRLYFRGDYSVGRLNHPWFPDTTVESFDTVVLRAGMNDHTNPFIRDELARALASDVGQPAAHGTFVNLFLNGVYKGYYNPCERIDIDFLRSYHGGGDKWDVIASFSELREGDLTAWNALRNYVNNNNPTNPAVYLEISRRLDLTNFVEYLLPLIYADTDDWPHNNWRAARERTPEGRFRFYVWDAEWSFGYNNPPTHDTIAAQLSSTSPPWGGTEIQRLFVRLRLSPEFRLLFADRVHKHFFNDGALTDAKIRARYDRMKAQVRTTIAGFNDTIGTTWIPQRRRNLMNHFAKAGFLLSSNAPAFNQLGGRVPKGFLLTMSTLATNGVIYYTTNGADPRVLFTGAVSADAFRYEHPLALAQDLFVKARTFLSETNWSALTEAAFQVADLGWPVRITEINYHPDGGDAYEFIEIQNVSGIPVDLSGVSLQGVEFRFSQGVSLAGGARVVLASALNRTLFAQRYPNVTVAGVFEGSLANGGERIALIDRHGRTITSVTYDDENGWPVEPDGGGRSLEVIDPNGDPNDPANWRASAAPGGSPGAANPPAAPSLVRLNEVFAGAGPETAGAGLWPDFIELHNAGPSTMNLSGWSLSTSRDGPPWVFPDGTRLAPNGLLVVWCDGPTNAVGLHADFRLSRRGETVLLRDSAGGRVDAVTLGVQAPAFSVGRTGVEAAWRLTEPTPGSLNDPASLGAPGDLAINEFLANPLPGQDDWIELHNTNPTLPVALHGLFLGTSNALFQIRSLSFVAPGGFVQLFADENAGPDHLDFKLPASGGVIILSDPTGQELSRLTYTAQREGVSAGRLPDGVGALTSFPNAASPGGPNFLATYAGPVLNEVMARNLSAVRDPAGRFADWIELKNPSSAAFNLSGMSLSVDEPAPRQWVFPPGTLLPGNGHLVVWCDDQRPASATFGEVLNTGRPLNGQSGGVYLFTQDGQLADFVEYGFQLEDRSIGRSGDGWMLLARATPGAANADPASLGSTSTLRLNEWLADARGQDWLELYNPDPLPVHLGGLVLTDDPSIYGQTNTVIAPLSFIAGLGWVKFQADADITKGRDHVRFKLDRLGETVRLLSPTTSIIDSVDLGVQRSGVAQGRFPDGAAEIVDFPTTPSPGGANYLPPAGVVINEVLSHTDPPLEDAIEVFNPSAAAVDLSGWFLSNTQRDLRKFRVPDGTVLPPRGYRVFYEFEFNPQPGSPASFTLNSAHGDEVHLSQATAEGRLTGYRASVKFGAAARGMSFGRYVASAGEDFVPLSARTFGADAPASLAQFRAGRGGFNAYPLVGPVVLSELMYHPITRAGASPAENEAEEFIELRNITASAVPLFDPAHPTNTWRLSGGVEFRFPPGANLPAHGFALVVNFDPLADPSALAAFRAKFDVPDGALLFGPYRGKLNNDGDEVALYRPDEPQRPPAPDAGFVPYVLVERLTYSDQAPWPGDADGTGASLQRRLLEAYGDQPANWLAAAPTAGRANASAASEDEDADRLPDAWEILHGFDPRDPTDAELDSDGDGLSNWQELITGDHPRDPTSFLHLEWTPPAGGGLTLRFTANAHRSYSVLFRDDLARGPWRRLRDVEPRPAAQIVEVHDPDPPRAGSRFYTIRTPKLP